MDILLTLLVLLVLIVSMIAYLTYLDSRLDPFYYYDEHLKKPKSFFEKLKDYLIEKLNPKNDNNDNK